MREREKNPRSTTKCNDVTRNIATPIYGLRYSGRNTGVEWLRMHIIRNIFPCLALREETMGRGGGRKVEWGTRREEIMEERREERIRLEKRGDGRKEERRGEKR